MAYTFKKIQYPIQKAHIEKSAASTALHKLRSFLNAAEPELAYFLVNTWNSQSKAITYKEIREAILAGDLDQAYLQQWHEDYSKFVTEHLQPAWTNAMEAATADMAAKFPDWNFDPYADGVRNWTDTKAAEFVTNVSTTQIEGIRAVVQRAAVLEDMTVDQLSRAIRPMVGLTHQQGIANLNYYTSLIKGGTSEAKALDLSVRYSARQHRYRAYNIARTELAFAYNQGSYEGTKQAQAAGYMGETVKVWCTADDERVCEVCGGLDGKQIAMDDDFDFNTKLATPANPTIRRVPPAHPSCRCAVIYEEITPPVFKPQPTDTTEEEDDTPLAEIPDDFALPAGLTYQGPANLGGTGKSYLYKDADGQEWIFKPGQNKDGSPALFRVYVQEAGYKVQHIIDPDTAVPICRFTDSRGTFGAMQKKIPGTSLNGELYKLYHGQNLPAELKSQIMREHVTDWLIANFDAHSKQFLSNASGALVGIDKDQAFKYLQKAAAKKMSYSFHPNSVFGENEPIYNPLYRMFAKGDIDLDLNDVLPYIKRVESISNSAYREIFREYAESLNGKGKAAEALLDDIVDRKDSLRATYRSFFEELLEERTGKKVAFKFADEGAEAAKQVLAAQTMTKEAAMKLPIADLKKMAKDKGIPWFSDMTKDQIATCVSDPTKIKEVTDQVKIKVAERAARRAAGKAKVQAQRVGKFTVTNGTFEAAEVFDDFTAIPQDRKLGIAVASDASKVEGLNLSARRVTVNGQDCIEISGKLTETATDDVKGILRRQGNRTQEIKFGKGPLTGGKAEIEDRIVLTSGTGYSLTSNGATIEIITDKTKRALSGTFRIRIADTGDAIADAATAKSAIKNSVLDFILDTPTQADEDLMKKARLLFQKDPAASVAFGKIKDKASEIANFARNARISLKDFKNLVKEEVFPGYFTFVNKGAHKKYQAAGLEYIWSGVSTKESVVAMVKSGGMSSTMSRIKTGFKGGSSADSDITSGGADNVFTRVASKLAAKNGQTYSHSFASGDYQIIIDPAVTDRTDWFAFHHDEFGTTRDDKMEKRDSAVAFFAEENKKFHSGNEVMFRHGIDLKHWLGIDCGTQTSKDRLIAAFKAEGITQINGVNVERFIRVNDIVGKAWP